MDEIYFFSNKDYLNLNSNHQTEHLTLEKSSISYTIINNIAYCPYQSTFALFTGEVNQKDIDTFIKKLLTQASKIHFLLPPLHYKNAQKHLTLLTQAGFRIIKTDLAQIRFLTENFEKGLSHTKQKKLRRLQKKNLITKKLDSTHFETCYQLIESNRASKNYEITIPKEKLKKLIEAFPTRFMLYGTFLENKMIACSVTIKISETALYQFIWAHDRAHDDISPLLFHNYQIHCEAKQNGYEMIDYGVCTIDGLINRGNYGFKKDLGAVNSRKYYLEYSY